ncbi:MAG: hypothetical protein ACLQMH_10405 [Solirubrobacteraceae bacterium]
MTALHSSEEPADLSAAGRDRAPGAVGVIEKRSTAAPLRLQSDDRASSERPAAAVVLRRSAMAILLYLDVILVVLLVPVALSLGASAVGYAIGAAAWVAQRIIAHADRRWISATRAPRTQLGLNLFEAFGRIWLLAGAIILAALVGGHAAGLTASVVIFAAYTVAFAIRVITGPPQRKVPK